MGVIYYKNLPYGGGTGDTDLNMYYTKEETEEVIDNKIENKVDKVEGYSLVADSEITRLASVDNYDDTNIQTDITALQEAIDANNEAGVGKKYYVDGVAKGEIFNDYSNNIASGEYSHTEGRNTVASGYQSHTEGYETKATNTNAHAEGSITEANGSNSHAEGYHTIANSDSSHAEGYYTTASGLSSHAEGRNTIASGSNSHAQNYRTIAASYGQTAMGKYNVEDKNDKYALIIGNGTDEETRSNAFAIDWDGNIYQGNEELGHNLATIQTSIDNKVDKLEGYSLVSDTEIAKLSAITNPIKIKGRVDTIDDFPSNASTGDLYFVGTDTSENYEEYVFTEDSKWEQIGVSQIDLSAYVLKEEGKGLSSNDYTDEEKTKLASLENYTLASTSQSGLMSAADKTKLDGLSVSSETPTKVMIENLNADYYEGWNEDLSFYIKSGNVVSLCLEFTLKDDSSSAKKLRLPTEAMGAFLFHIPCTIYHHTTDDNIETEHDVGYFTSTYLTLPTTVSVGDTIFISTTYVT